MKIFTKLFIVILLFTISLESFAQSFGIRAGMNLSTVLCKDDDGTYSNNYKMRPGFNVGAIALFPINKTFSFEPGLLLSTKGYKEKYSEPGYEETENFNLLYIDVPLNVKASFDVGSVKLFGMLGPYIGIGVSGKDKYKGTESGQSFSDSYTVKWGSDADNDDLKRLDFGATIGAGVDIKSFQISISYDLGLANVSSFTDYGTKVKNRVLAISVGYFFKK
jgi:hypothetical protein